MAYGTPVIATRSGGLAELMAGLPKEFCVEPGSTQELRDAIQLFLNQDYDFASVFRDHAALYNWEKVVIRTNECYAKAIEM
jgi:glycosyltransferase involved in cell wall biosynthesis